MKKLLYTLLIGLVIVSCQKEEYGGDLAPNALSDIEATINIDAEGIMDRLISTTKGNSKKSLTSKDAVRGTSYITIYEKIADGSLIEFAFDDTKEFCYDDSLGFDLLTIAYNDDGHTDIYLGDLSGYKVATLTTDFGFVFALDIKQGIRINLDTKNLETASESNNVFTF